MEHARTGWIAAVLLAALANGSCIDIPGPPDGPQDPDCLKSAVFGPPSESDYVLPYLPDSAYTVFQTYCGPVSHGKDGQMSIDFLMEEGTEVVAARSGVVRSVTDRHADDSRSFNHIYVEHEDGSSAFYGHLLQGGARVAQGDSVAQGQVIALSGSSGTSLPHLYFGVAREWPPRHPDDFPVNFSNAEGELDARGGLKRGVAYRALRPKDN